MGRLAQKASNKKKAFIENSLDDALGVAAASCIILNKCIPLNSDSLMVKEMTK